MNSNINFQVNLDTNDINVTSNIESLPIQWTVSFVSNEDIILFNDLRIDLMIFNINEQIIFQKKFPNEIENQQYEMADSGILETASLPLEADQTYTIKTKVAESGNTYISEKEIVAPRPEKPYESWIWNGEEYVAPKQMPKDRKDYYWDESIRLWVVEPDYEVE